MLIRWRVEFEIAITHWRRLRSSALSHPIAFCAETFKPFCQHALNDLAHITAVDAELDPHEFDPGRHFRPSTVIRIEQDPLFHSESAHVVNPSDATRRIANSNDTVNSSTYRVDDVYQQSAARLPGSAAPLNTALAVNIRKARPQLPIGKYPPSEATIRLGKDGVLYAHYFWSWIAGAQVRRGAATGRP